MATYNGTTLAIDIPLAAGTVIASEGAPDVAGAAVIGNTMYCVKTSVILKLNTAGAVLDSYDISSIVPDGARGITAENETDEKFIVMNYDMVYDHKPAFKFNVVQWGGFSASETFPGTEGRIWIC